MGQLRDMTERELIFELSEVESAIRLARTPAPVPAALPPGMTADGWEDLAVLASREHQIVSELRQRRANAAPTPRSSWVGRRKEHGCASAGAR
jgi:hypothetical protein